MDAIINKCLIKKKMAINIVSEAIKIVNERAQEKERMYGPFSECNLRASKIASVLSSKEVTVEDMYHMQIALKLARESHNHKEDNLLDVVAYIGALNNYKENIKVEEKDITKNGN
jgi:hypothetical protein